MYACMHVCMHACMYAGMCVRMVVVCMCALCVCLYAPMTAHAEGLCYFLFCGLIKVLLLSLHAGQRLGTAARDPGPRPPRGRSRYVDITGEFHLDLIQDQDTLLLQNKLEGSKYKP